MSWPTDGISAHNNNANNNYTADAGPHIVDAIFKRDFPFFVQQLNRHTTLCSDVAQIIVEYLASNDNPFGTEDWKKLGFDPGPEPELPQKFYQFWYGPDAGDLKEHTKNPNHPIRLNYETHLPPVFITKEFSLQVLGEIGLKYEYDTEALRQKREQKADLTCWLVLRKGVFARNESSESQKKYMQDLNRETGANYEEMPSVIDLACVVFARFKSTEERHLGDGTGAENRWTYSRCKETVKYGNGEYLLVVGGFDLDGLVVKYGNYPDSLIGVAGLRKFLRP